MEEENEEIADGENSESSRDEKDKTGDSSLEEASKETGKSKSKNKSKISRSKTSKLS